jgi:hypothetical protein
MINLMLLTISLCLVFAPVVNPAVAQDATPSMAASGFGEAKMVGRIESDCLVECSGLESSMLAGDLFFTGRHVAAGHIRRPPPGDL